FSNQEKTRMKNGRLKIGISALALAIAGFILAGCGGDENVRASRGSESESGASAEGSDLNSQAADDRGLVGISADEQAQFLDPNNPLSTRVFYFEYDSDAVSADYERPLEAHANFLKKHGNLTIRLEGHADERGT